MLTHTEARKGRAAKSDPNYPKCLLPIGAQQFFSLLKIQEPGDRTFSHSWEPEVE